MPVKYDAVALKKCQFQGVLYPTGRRYSGFKKPPDGLFRVDKTENLSEEAVAEQKEKEKKARQTKVPSDPTPRNREEEAQNDKARSGKHKQTAGEERAEPVA